VGKAEREGFAKEGRSAREEINSTPHESSNAEEIVGFDEGKMGGVEEGWCEGFIEPS
jgi:hypothetical protein